MATSKKRKEARERGLPSLNQARAERHRAIVFGKVRVRAMPPVFWLWLIIGIAVFGVVYWRVAEGELQSQKNAVMAKQRAVSKTLGPKILPFRDKVERWVSELSGKWPGNHVAEGFELEDVRTSPGVYLRLRMKNAESPETIREAAARSLHDGFTSCFFIREGEGDPTKGPACNTSDDCAPGLLCNEWDKCVPPPRPYNMRLAYRALKVLSTGWTDHLHQATSELAVRAQERDLVSVTKNDVPIAIDLLANAEYFTLVLDEEPKGGLPEPLSDAGTETDEERIQRVEHMARVGIWSIHDGRLLARLRQPAEGRFVPVGDRVVQDSRTRAAQARQANSCALAVSIRRAVSARHAPDDGAGDAGAVPDAGVGVDAGASDGAP